MLKAVGAKHILLNTMPDIGRTPLSVLVGSDAAALLTRNSVSYRNALFSAIDAQSLTAQNVSSVNVTTESTAVPSAQFAVVDAFLGMDVIFRQPEAYGFAEETLNVNCARGFSSTENLFSIPQGICADPDSYFFWDLLHPTRVVHSLFAQIAASSLLKTGWISRR
ncbi:SGNH hydrolase-type esterase domain [Phaffia rhodozyma]|uniref:SGNH hydrolase-type esterase domain n=1 Tax=Phaffia rhodozyma TaxID=264483 RepID=A0A0F7SKT3_PHARH|nr:SGNH hydrolase-type esterase domain [Phaffia rhodozyma]